MSHPWFHIARQIAQNDFGVKPQDLPMVRHRDGQVARLNHPLGGVTPRAAAVLVIVVPNDTTIDIILTRRGGHLRQHGGEIAFPGGKVDENETPMMAALREAEEELGISATVVHVLGTLHTIYVPRSNHLVTPVVAWCDVLPLFSPNPDEVAEVFMAPITTILPTEALCFEERQLGTDQLIVPYFLINEYRVWGATALMLCDFIARIRAFNAMANSL